MLIFDKTFCTEGACNCRFFTFFFLSNFIRIAITQKQDLPSVSSVQKHLLDAFAIRWTRQLRQISRFKHRKKIHLDVKPTRRNCCER